MGCAHLEKVLLKLLQEKPMKTKLLIIIKCKPYTSMKQAVHFCKLHGVSTKALKINLLLIVKVRSLTNWKIEIGVLY